MRAGWRSTILLLAALVPASGCLVTGALDGKGGGRLRLHYRVASVLNFEQHKAMLQSPAVVIESSAMTPDKWVTFDLKFADVRALPTVPFLSHLHVDLQEAPGSRILGVTIDNPVASPMPEVVRNYLGRDFQISLELPGSVLESNGRASGDQTVTWSIPVDEAAARPTLSFTATYKAGG